MGTVSNIRGCVLEEGGHRAHRCRVPCPSAYAVGMFEHAIANCARRKQTRPHDPKNTGGQEKLHPVAPKKTAARAAPQGRTDHERQTPGPRFLSGSVPKYRLSRGGRRRSATSFLVDLSAPEKQRATLHDICFADRSRMYVRCRNESSGQTRLA